MYTVYSLVLYLVVWYIVGLSFIVIGSYNKSTGHSLHTDRLIWDTLSLNKKLIVILFVPIMPFFWPIFLQENLVDIIKEDTINRRYCPICHTDGAYHPGTVCTDCMRLSMTDGPEGKECSEALNRIRRTMNEIKRINNIIQ